MEHFALPDTDTYLINSSYYYAHMTPQRFTEGRERAINRWKQAMEQITFGLVGKQIKVSE